MTLVVDIVLNNVLHPSELLHVLTVTLFCVNMNFLPKIALTTALSAVCLSLSPEDFHWKTLARQQTNSRATKRSIDSQNHLGQKNFIMLKLTLKSLAVIDKTFHKNNFKPPISQSF